MGRVARTGGSDSGRAVERTKNIGKPRTKRKKRKDLEELHRNVLDAKRHLRTRVPQKKKRKTALGKVLKNFAEKRQENEGINHGYAEKKSRKRKARTICNRLLPEPILGIYQNGLKGREVHKANWKLDKINAARLQGDMLKLLTGDETNPKLSWNGGEKRAGKAKRSKAFPSDESDSASSTGDCLSRVNTPVLGETQGVKRINGEKKKTNLIGENALAGTKNEKQQFLQRENKCKRRLFEPNEDQLDSNCLGNSEDRQDFLMDAIRFSPSPGIARNVSPPGDYFRKNQYVESTDIETRKKAEKKLVPIEAAIDANFWGWSPTIYYERLCAMICADNFENNQQEQLRGPDPVTKIRRTLREFYKNACRYRHPGRKTVIAKGNKRREEALPKVSCPLRDSSLSSTREFQACTTDSELDRESSDSDATKFGSSRSRYFNGILNPKDSSVLPNTNDTTVESKNHDKGSQLKRFKPAVANKQNRHGEKKTAGVEKTISSVSLFLEKLRENNPLYVKGNIFEVEVAANSEDSHRDLPFDMNLRNLLRRNTKHVPSILRRSNSRCGLVERVDEKHQPPPSNNWAKNGPKRSTRTIAALPRWSSPKLNDSDDLQTPSVVNHLADINKAKENIFKSQLNFIRAKCKPDARSLSPEYQAFEKSAKKDDKYVGKERKTRARQVFVNATSADDREWYPSDPVLHDQQYAREPNIDRREVERERRKVNFGKKKDTRDFKESNLRTFETVSPEYISKYQLPPSHHDNARYHMETTSSFSSFEFAYPEVPNEMENIITQRFSEKNTKKPFVRPRYLPEDSKTSVSTRVSRHSNAGPSASRCVNEIQFPPEEYVERIPMCSKTKNQKEDRSFTLLPSYHADTLSLDRMPSEVAGCAERCRGVALHQRIRKPVMLFRPIQETRQQQEICDTRYRLPENSEATINDAVRNFRVLTFDENTVNQSSYQRQASHGSEMYHLRHKPEQQQSLLQQTRCHRRLPDNRQRHSQEFDTRPTKYLAFNETDGRNPCRLPIYVKNDATQVSNAATGPCHREDEPSKFFNVFRKPENPKMMYLRCRDVDDSREHAARVHCCGQQQQPHKLGPCPASQVTLMLPCSAPGCQQASTNLPATTAPTLGPTSIKDIPRVVYSMTACETLVPAEMTHQLEPPLYAQSRYDNEGLSKRVQLPDGSVGILMTENCLIDNTERVDRSGGPNLSFERIDMGNLNERNHSSLVNERIYY